MNHLFLLLGCIICIEIFFKFNFPLILMSIFNITIKVIHVLLNKKISDHWKSIIIPFYAIKIIKLSFQILFITICNLSIFFGFGIILEGFLIFSLSYIGFIEFIFFTFIYIFMRKLVLK